MEIQNRLVVVTGGGSGIGRAMVERFAKNNPSGIAVVDRDGDAARTVAERVDGLAITADLSRESEVLRVIAQTETQYGPIDLFCSNAGIVPPIGGFEVPDDGWQTHWNTHVMAHVWAARALVPAMARRGEGYLLSTASAAGLVMSPGAVPYAVTKHAALALAESLALLYHGSGVRFSCLCPALVETPLVAGVDGEAVGRAVRAAGPWLDPATVADMVVEGLREERFLILTHPETAGGAVLRATDADAYLEAMSGLWSAVGERLHDSGVAVHSPPAGPARPSANSRAAANTQMRTNQDWLTRWAIPPGHRPGRQHGPKAWPRRRCGPGVPRPPPTQAWRAAMGDTLASS